VTGSQDRPLRLFVSFAPEDRDLKDDLLKHLAVLQRPRKIDVWSVDRVGPGEDWRRELDAALAQADVALLLVSVHLLFSDFLSDVEVPALFERRARDGLRIIPVLLGTCLWQQHPWIGQLKPTPADGIAIAAHSGDARNQSMTEVAAEVSRLVIQKRVSTVQPNNSPHERGHTRPAPVYSTSSLLNEIASPAGNIPRTPFSSSPTPKYPDHETRLLAEKLADAQARKRRLDERGEDSSGILHEILALKRTLRDGGQVRAGDSLGGDRYLLLNPLGHGGFASVWRAQDSHAKKIVAIKVLHSNLAGDRVRLDRFRRGARTMSQLKHESIVQVLEEYAQEGGWHYFVMEYLSGGDLRQAVLGRRIERAQVLPLILRICDAVAFAHSRNIIHRDIKPANIVIDEHGDPKLTDFDLVTVPDTTGGTRTGAFGTFLYAAPEILSDPDGATTRSDVYGIGMTTLFGLLGGELPIDLLRSPGVVFDRIAMSSYLRSVLVRAISWNQRERHHDASILRDAMKSALGLPDDLVARDGADDHEFSADEPVYPPIFDEEHVIEGAPPGFPRRVDYRRYYNTRFGFAVDVPIFLVPQPGPANGDGRRFEYNESFGMVASGIRSWDNSRAAQALFDEEMDRIANDVEVTLLEKVVEGNCFAIRARVRGVVSHGRRVLADGIIAGVELSYPAAQEAYFDSIARRVISSFRFPLEIVESSES
jgi:eukaryotic-like serine/threonine-protein kinase